MDSFENFCPQKMTKITEYDFILEGFCSVADPYPGSGIRCLLDPWIREPGWVKNQDPDPR
jgi:hypothetical protein